MMVKFQFVLGHEDINLCEHLVFTYDALRRMGQGSLLPGQVMSLRRNLYMSWLNGMTNVTHNLMQDYGRMTMVIS